MKPILLTLFPLCLCLAQCCVAATVSLSEPRLVATDPDGASQLYWSADSRAVQVNPFDWRQNIKWGSTYLDAQTGAFVPDPSDGNPFKLQGGDEKNASVELYSPTAKKTVALQQTPWDKFGFDLDSWSFGWRFQDVRFSKDAKQVSILADGTIYTWSTVTGKLLRQVQLTPAPEDHTYSFASFSKDGERVIAPLTDKFGAGLFDAKTGRRLFALPASNWARYWAGFFLDDELLVAYDYSDRNHRQIASIWSISQRRKLWSAFVDLTVGMQLLPQSDVAIAVTEKNIELHNTLTGRLLQTYAHPAPNVNYFAPAPDGSQIWASYANGQIWSWRVQDSEIR